MKEDKVTIINSMGMHSRAAAQFVAFCYKYNFDNIQLIMDNKTANAKSILNLIMLSIKQGDEVTVRVEGESEEETLKEIVEFLKTLHD